jgi:hypothetical protein
MKLLNLFIFFTIFLGSYYSVSGYGILFNKLLLQVKKKKEFINISVVSFFFTGLSLLIPVSFFNYIFFGFNLIVNCFILILGFVIFFFNVRILSVIKVSILPSCLFVGLLISKTHDDFALYHFQYLKELSDNALKLGLANIDVRYGYSSLFSYIQGIFILPYYGLKFFHVPVYLIYTSLINYLFFKSFEVKNNKKFLIIFLEIFLIIKFKRLSEFGYDYLVQFLLIYLFVEFYTLARKTKENIFANLVIYLSAIAFKIISIFFLPIILFFLYVEKKYFIECLKNKLYFFSLLFIFFIILFDSFLKTGCLHYAFPITCLSRSTISWAIDINSIESNANMITLWAKGFYHQGPERVEDTRLYLQNFNWIFNWIYIHFYKKILDSIFVGFLIFIFLYFFKSEKKLYDYEKYIIFFLLLSLILWLLVLPQFRFGFSIIILLTYFILKTFFRKDTRIQRNQFILIMIFLLIYFNYMNLLRIKEEFTRNDEYKYVNFPFFPIDEKKYLVRYTSANNRYFSPVNKQNQDHCFNLPTICSAMNIDLLFYNIFHKKIILIKKNND